MKLIKRDADPNKMTQTVVTLSNADRVLLAEFTGGRTFPEVLRVLIRTIKKYQKKGKKTIDDVKFIRYSKTN